MQWHLQEKLDSEAYRILNDNDIGLLEKCEELSKFQIVFVYSGANLAASFALCRLMANPILVNIEDSAKAIASGILGDADMIIKNDMEEEKLTDAMSNMLKAKFKDKGKDKLKEETKKLREATKRFQLATRKYSNVIYETLSALKFP